MNFNIINTILDRDKLIEDIKNDLNFFEDNKKNMLIKRGIYIYGCSGTGKTMLIKNILKQLDYDVIYYNAGDIRNKNVIETITKHNISDKNVISLFNKKKKNIAIVMDEIDGMNNGDKGGINSLIKLIRPKKTKKQKLEEYTNNPIICIGNTIMDKKIKELIKICNSYELENPTNIQICNICKYVFVDIKEDYINNVLINFINKDIRKLNYLHDLYLKDKSILTEKKINDWLCNKSYNEDIKIITKNILNKKYNINNHLSIINDADRTIIALLFHENIIDIFNKWNIKLTIPFYIKILKNICFADFIDRVTFQKQIWQFNEMSSLIKTMYNQYILHNYTDEQKINKQELQGEMRFTKVLTKYSTEYNNSLFLLNLCQELSMDKKDLYSFFYDLQRKKMDETEMITIFENNNIQKLDIQRMFRYIDSYTIDIDDME